MGHSTLGLAGKTSNSKGRYKGLSTAPRKRRAASVEMTVYRKLNVEIALLVPGPSAGEDVVEVGVFGLPA